MLFKRGYLKNAAYCTKVYSDKSSANLLKEKGKTPASPRNPDFCDKDQTIPHR